MDRSHIDKIAENTDDRVLLAKLWDKINAGMRRNMPAFTSFLSPREQEMARYLFGDAPGLYAFGGYDEAERKMLCYLPEYMEEASLYEDDSPVVCLRAQFYDGDSPSHRDFLGGLMACGIARETLGDICVGKSSCDFFITSQIADYVAQNLTSVGRTKLQLRRIPLVEADIPSPQFKEIKDTVASLRLDSVIASGFRIGRNVAREYVAAGKVAIDGLSCEKADKAVAEGAKISVRGLGKMKIHSIGGQTKKDRIWIMIHRYI